ncbi:hypothetical protein HUT03_03930 [Candidatus Liberibacter africanus]|uniref:Major capsid protein n=1 Tax=Candidatus Liberibacter africanus PTSAPSY TaxID=1277257 RepID=A0A0G3I3I3_LIBAF|nr:phage capsid protein [Candidatus Liberibacter africanus]AKK20404.1 hypothetical protein G293_03900 [Candidatus Liberibacter africanus PTSAPSY]QTP64135.1 hypothetical protein HUT03_03930 [Candidatus Liberibacter africanus]
MTQNFDSIPLPNVKSKISLLLKSKISLLLNGNKTGIIGCTDVINNVDGDSFSAYLNNGPSTAELKLGTKVPTPKIDVSNVLRIIKPKDYHDAIAIDREEDDKLTYDLAKVLGNSLLKVAESEVVRGAFGENTVDHHSSTSTKNFDPNMIIPVDYKRSPSSSVSVADKIMGASAMIKSGVDVDNADLFLALTGRAYASFFAAIKMINKDYVKYVNLENGKIRRFAGFRIISSDYMPGGKNSPKEFDAEGKITAKDSIPLKSISTAPEAKDKVKSYALFWERSGIITAFWKDIQFKILEDSKRSGAQSMYASCQLGACRSDESRVGYIEMDV